MLKETVDDEITTTGMSPRQSLVVSHGWYMQ